MKRILMVILLLAASCAQAQSVSALRRADEVFPSLQEVAQVAGYSMSESANGLTVRAPAGILTVFVGSPDVLWRPAQASQKIEDGVSLSAPVTKEWYAPPDAFALLDIEVAEARVSLPDGRVLSLYFPPPAVTQGGGDTGVVSLRQGVSGLMLYAPGSSSAEASLLLVDAELLALALPGARTSLDSVLEKVEGSRPLYFVAAALEPTAWQTNMTFTQGGRSFTAKAPFSLSLLEGSEQLRPDAPASGVVLLPQWISLREPLAVSWMGTVGSFQFRR